MTDNALMLITPAIAIQQAKYMSDIVRELRREVLRKDVDYGVIPGTNNKEVLLKPGAERLCSAFGFSPEFEVVKAIENWDVLQPLFHYQYRCRLINSNGRTVATGIGSCNSMESKYRWRKGERVCPECGNESIRKSKDGRNGATPGFYCWGKIGGCGAQFEANDERIASQAVGRVPNRDIYDLVNTIDKMAQKRSLIASALIGCNASEFFTQDIIDEVASSSDDVVEGEIVDDAPPESPAHWTQNEAAMGQFNAKVKESFGLSQTEAEDLLGKTYTEFETRAEAGVAVKEAMEKLAKDKPAAPKSKATADKPKSDKKPAEAKKDEAPESWYKKDSRTIAIWTRTHFGREPNEVLHDIKAKSWDDFKDIFTACARIKEVASSELWDVRAEKATYTEADHSIRFKTPIGDLVTWSRKALVEAAQFAGQDNWKDVPNWEEGQHTLPDPVWLILESKDDQIIIKEIRNASIAF